MVLVQPGPSDKSQHTFKPVSALLSPVSTQSQLSLYPVSSLSQQNQSYKSIVFVKLESVEFCRLLHTYCACQTSVLKTWMNPFERGETSCCLLETKGSWEASDHMGWLEKLTNFPPKLGVSKAKFPCCFFLLPNREPVKYRWQEINSVLLLHRAKKVLLTATPPHVVPDII
jgi:hypothetical protein